MKLDGREFAEVDHKITAAQNDYILAHLRLAGVMDLLVKSQTTNPTEQELGALRRQFITEILLSGEKSSILAGAFTETGKKWSRAEADRNAARFDEITDPVEIKEMTDVLAGVVISFFRSAGTSSKTSPRSSSPSDEVPAIESADLEISESSPQ
jgi:hypothetical protein